jgi:hypothetical protein
VRRRLTLLLLLCPAVSCASPVDAPAPPDLRAAIPLEARDLPADADFIPLSLELDFTDLLRRAGMDLPFDDRSLRLFRIDPDGRGHEETLQFLPAPQPRPPGRPTLPDTPPTMSLAAEYPAGRPLPPGVRQAGTISWIARKGASRWRLELSAPRTGRFVQVPYPPYDLRAFDEHSRAPEPRAFPLLRIRPQRPLDGRVHFEEGGTPVLVYHVGPAAGDPPDRGPRRPFFYPVLGPRGDALTEFGKPHDPEETHAHHYSLWIAHASVGGRNFWTERGGRIAHDGLERLQDGPLFCRLIQKTRWLDGPEEVLRERRAFMLWRSEGGVRLLDVELELRPAGPQPLTLGPTSFGFLAVRAARSLSPFDGGGRIRDAEGRINERGVHLRRSAWIDLSGPVAPGRRGGVAILDHPDNPSHPTAWHCRDDGWMGAAATYPDPIVLEPGRPLRLRYRVVLHDGDADEARIALRWREYAARPGVRAGEAVRVP